MTRKILVRALVGRRNCFSSCTANLETAGKGRDTRFSYAILTTSAVPVGRSRRGNVAGDLRPAGVRPNQSGGEGDTAARDLCTGRVRTSQRRGDGDSRPTSATAGGGDDR